MAASTRSGRAPARSVLFTKMSVGIRSRRSARISTRVCAWTPSTEEMTSTVPSRTPSTRSTSAMKSGWPGVSIRLTVTSPMTNDTTADLIVMPRWGSSASESVWVLPSSTLPILSMTPAECSSRSVRLVLPASTCARIPKLSVFTKRHVLTHWREFLSAGHERCSHGPLHWVAGTAQAVQHALLREGKAFIRRYDAPGCRDPGRRRGLQVEGRGHGREGGRLPQRGQAEQLPGGAEEGVVVEQRRRPRAGPGAGADHDGGDVAADVGLVGGARGGGPAFALVPGDEHRGRAAGVLGALQDRGQVSGQPLGTVGDGAVGH